ncbi:MAG: MATE family efflux transporter [Planctomycetaceae bacterium]|nr:MATE family efflux transporter [Planctomycetaceae bacterium]
MNYDEKVRRLETHGVGHLLWEFSLPAIFAAVVNALQGIINRIFVGQTLGEIGMTAVTVTFPIITIMLAVGMTIGIGSNTLISIRLGEKKNKEAEEVVGQSLFLFMLFGIGFMLFGLLFQEPLLRLFGTSDRVMPHAKMYLSVMVCGAFFHEMSFGVNSFLRSEGKPKTAMNTTVIMVLLNVFFDWLFLIVLHTDIWGAALATILAQICSSAWVAWHYIYGSTLLRWRWKYIRWNPKLAKEVFILGMPPFLFQAVTCVIQAIQIRQIAYYGHLYGEKHGFENGGDTAIGAFGIVFVVWMLTVFPLIGLNQGAQSIIGYNIGAKHYRRVARTLKLTLISALVFALVCSVILFVFPETILYPFVPQQDGETMLMLGCRAVRFFVIFFPIGALVMAMTSYYQAIGEAKTAIVLSLIRQAVMLIPALIFLPLYFGLDGVWLSLPLCDAGTFLPAAVLLWMEWRRLKTLGGLKTLEKVQEPV